MHGLLYQSKASLSTDQFIGQTGQSMQGLLT
jgi:hypothetical protein